MESGEDMGISSIPTGPRYSSKPDVLHETASLDVHTSHQKHIDIHTQMEDSPRADDLHVDHHDFPALGLLTGARLICGNDAMGRQCSSKTQDDVYIYIYIHTVLKIP